MSEGILYKKGHDVPERFIVEILKNLGCEKITNNDYQGNNLKGGIPTKRGLLPDFYCEINGRNTPVEVGQLNERSGMIEHRISRIQEMLSEFCQLIHIYPDSKNFMLHCVVYKESVVLSGAIVQAIKDNRNLCNTLLSDIDILDKHIKTTPSHAEMKEAAQGKPII